MRKFDGQWFLSKFFWRYRAKNHKKIPFEIYPLSFIDVLEELEEDETDTDLLDENSGRDAETRLLMAVDRLKDLR